MPHKTQNSDLSITVALLSQNVKTFEKTLKEFKELLEEMQKGLIDRREFETYKESQKDKHLDIEKDINAIRGNMTWVVRTIIGAVISGVVSVWLLLQK